MSADRGAAPRTAWTNLAKVLAWLAFAVACAINLYGLYVPSQPGPPMFPGFDKIAHLASFALLMLTGLLVGFRARPLALVLAAHAVLSEVLQGTLLPERSGDLLDALTDLAGIGLGWLIWWAGRRWRASRGASLARRASDAPAGTGRAR